MQTQIKQQKLKNVISMLNNETTPIKKLTLKEAKIKLLKSDFTTDISNELKLINEGNLSAALVCFLDRNFIFPTLLKFINKISKK
ncbi:hypothetical protein CSPB12327_06945 [Campylobacter sp. RM12327]|uniref:hypothetical protein n=1 Tax=Campylobacter sputorum TaxID=206 RepID=UPI000B77565B|nr:MULTISPECIES: hypothetical protein [Campylobacter]ASM39466.1 hypothetical protein CSPB_0201 [Campylobacter sputorum]MBE7358367.1 hypothetical protein [Campylobacter sp. RM11302]MBF6669874.1 hypothetical protein [Campylobacter sp. RM12327]MBF6675075.1 hypothetical protein [Campylobacter sp. RM13538]MBF6676748.1 hypothetical protein [Campylobacter sp. RM12321]